MISDINDFTWQSLYEYIERRISGVLDVLQRINMDSQANDLSPMSESLERQLDLLRWCLPLVSEMQKKENLQVICPIMSLELIRLRCRSQHDSQVHSSDFAWITPIADGIYQLVQREVNNSETKTPLSMEGNIFQIIEKVELLVKEKCTQAKQ